jgi:hypothetical protein
MNLIGMDAYDDFDEVAERHRADHDRVEGDGSDLETAGNVLQSAGQALSKLLAAKKNKKGVVDALVPPKTTPKSDEHAKPSPWYVQHPWMALGAAVGAGVGLGLLAKVMFGGGKRRR